MLFNNIFGRKNSNSSNSSSSKGVKLNKKNHQPRRMTLEPLETRDLLSVTTGAIDNAEYAEIRAQYPDFNLPKLQADLNVMTITPTTAPCPLPTSNPPSPTPERLRSLTSFSFARPQPPTALRIPVPQTKYPSISTLRGTAL